jgi:glycosyltransferase involved in cell wall biosynthesis
MSVIIPAYNEEAVLPSTLIALQAAVDVYRDGKLGSVEVIVTDNASTDDTARVATAHGAKVVTQPIKGIGHARNAGAAAARAPILYFLDADVAVPSDVLVAIDAALGDGRCHGGAVAPDYRPASKVLVHYNRLWAMYARRRHMTQGVSQFATRSAFDAIGGYRTDMWMAEDTQFGWDLRAHALAQGGHVTVITETLVVPSTRRMDEWGAWTTIWRTNPLITSMRRRSEGAWRHWYGDDTVR